MPPQKFRGFSLLSILITGLAISASFVGSFYLYSVLSKNSSSKTPDKNQEASPNPTPEAMPGWQMHKDNLYSFTYPQEWTVRRYKTEVQGEAIKISNSKESVVINIYSEEQPFAFGKEKSNFKRKEIKLSVDGNEYTSEEVTIPDDALYVELKVKKPSGNQYQIMFGTGYPAGSDSKASLNDYHKYRETILEILSSLKIRGL